MGYTPMPIYPKRFLPCRRWSRLGNRCTPASFGTMSFFKKCSVIAVLFAVVVPGMGTYLIAQVEEAEVPFLYPDPRTVGLQPYVMQGTPACAVTVDRYAGISEQEGQLRMQLEQYANFYGLPQYDQPPCPLCLEEPLTPCRTCKMCLAGFPCENTLCRHCVQPRSKNMMSSCDLTAGDEPCGTCDACREHRSDPCEHADSGYGPRGEFNPYKEPPLLSVIPRPILDAYNNGARKFPIYYNPAPYVRPTWNPSMSLGYARPFTYRYTCPLCFRDPCGCDTPGLAGQVPYAFACKFCNRNPCACAAEICNVNKAMDPVGIATALAEMKKEAEPEDTQNTESSTTTSTSSPETPSGSGGVLDWIDDNAPVLVPDLPVQP